MKWLVQCIWDEVPIYKQILWNYFGLVNINVGWIFVFVPSINGVSNWVYAYMSTGSYFFKNLEPTPTRHFLKINTHPHLITGDFNI
jgi:hypothetical protein